VSVERFSIMLHAFKRVCCTLYHKRHSTSIVEICENGYHLQNAKTFAPPFRSPSIDLIQK